MKLTMVKTLQLVTVIAFIVSGSFSIAAEQGGMTVGNGGEATVAQKNQSAQDAKMAWWRVAKFGMFIHWGVYALPANGEWIMNKRKIPVAEYQEYAKKFNPMKYDPKTWVKIARDTGMKYIVITAKHHDGFAMFDSKVSDWNIVARTPYQKDVLKPLAETCRKEDIRLGFYYSQAQDWSNGGSAIGEKWDPAQNRDFDEYIDKIAVPQVRELLTNYGTDVPAILWWDTPQDMNATRAKPILDAVTTLRPDIVQNNRIGGYLGDYKTPENFVPVSGVSGDWETCMTINNSWGYNKSDNHWKSSSTIIRKLADICSKGGNLLLNVGPTAEGEFPQPAVECLQGVGQWMKANGESIYGTKAGPFSHLSWGCSTRKGDLLYLHVFEWPKDGTLRVPLLCNAKAAWLLTAPEKKLDVSGNGEHLTVRVPSIAPDESDSVVILQLNGEPMVAPLPTVGATATASAAQPDHGPENLIDGSSDRSWVAPMGVKSASAEIDLGRKQIVAGFGFDEPDVWPRMKQTFTMDALVGGTWQRVAEGKTEGHGSAGTFPAVTARVFRITMNCDKGAPAVAELQLYRPE